MRHVVVVEVRGQELAVLVVDELLVEGGADRVHGRAVHLALDDLRVDPGAAVVHGRVVDDLDDAGLPVDLDHARVDLGRVGQRQLARLLLRVDHAEVRPVDEAVVQGRVEVGRQEGVVRVHDRAERHERQRRLGRPSLIRAKPSASSIASPRTGAPPPRARPSRRAAPRRRPWPRPGDRELARVGSREAGVRVEEGVVALAHVHLVGRAAEDVGDDLRRRRLVALPLRHRPERDDELAEDVELHRRRLVVPGELQLRVEQRRLAEVVRPGVERRADPDPEQLPRAASSRRVSIES